jgi:hypothetical protein
MLHERRIQRTPAAPKPQLATFGELVEGDELGKSLLYPATRSRVDFLRVDAHGYQDFDVLGAKNASLFSQ